MCFLFVLSHAVFTWTSFQLHENSFMEEIPRDFCTVLCQRKRCWATLKHFISTVCATLQGHWQPCSCLWCLRRIRQIIKCVSWRRHEAIAYQKALISWEADGVKCRVICCQMYRRCSVTVPLSGYTFGLNNWGYSKSIN